MESALLAGAVASAAIAGFLFGLVAEIAAVAVGRLVGAGTIPSTADVEPMVIVGIIAVGVVLDVSGLLTGRPRPLTVGRQVPREWGRLLPLPVTAFLYGARLGVGPLTILSTWMWWSALVGAGLAGVWTAVAVSVWFAAWRVAINGVVGRGLARRPASNLAAVRLWRHRGWSGLTGLAAALTATTVLLAGCGLPGDSAARPVLLDRAESDMPTAAVDTKPTPPTSPAQLEDFVRTSSTLAEPGPSTPPRAQSVTPTEPTVETTADTAVTDQIEPVALAELAPASLSGMAVVDDPTVDRFLTIDEAAAIQPDPTEEIALLETRGYRGGWIRAFRSPASDVAVASVYEFADSTEAEFYLEDGLITIGGYGGQFFDMAELPDVRGFQQDVVDDGETVRTLGGAFHRDNRWFLLYIVGSPQTVNADTLLPALRSWRGDLGF